jgi:hypothetical protein
MFHVKQRFSRTAQRLAPQCSPPIPTGLRGALEARGHRHTAFPPIVELATSAPAPTPSAAARCRSASCQIARGTSGCRGVRPRLRPGVSCRDARLGRLRRIGVSPTSRMKPYRESRTCEASSAVVRRCVLQPRLRWLPARYRLVLPHRRDREPTSSTRDQSRRDGRGASLLAMATRFARPAGRPRPWRIDDGHQPMATTIGSVEPTHGARMRSLTDDPSDGPTSPSR